MIARTTTVGLLLALGYLFYKSDIWRLKLSAESRKLWLYLGGVLLITTPLCFYLYQQDAIFRSNLRFAFEGFFSLIEKENGKCHPTRNYRTCMSSQIM